MENAKSFYKKFFLIAGPIIIQNVVSSSLYLVDTLMTGSLGENELSGVAQAGQFAFLLQLFIIGISAGAGVFAAQFWGKGDKNGVNKALTTALMINMTLGMAFFLVAQFAPRFILNIYLPNDALAAAAGARYLSIVAVTFFTISISITMTSVLRSTGHVKLPMIAGIVSIITNVTFDYLLIFGNLGFPRLGLDGTAIGTLIAALAEFTLIVAVSYIKRYPAALRPRQFRFPELSFIKSYIKTSLPMVVNDGLYGIYMSCLWLVYGRMDSATAVVAAMSIVGAIEKLGHAFSGGFSAACGIVTGAALGKNDFDGAFRNARRVHLMGLPVWLFVIGLVLLVRTPVINLFNVSGEAKLMASQVVLVFAGFYILMYINLTTLVGTLRSGGDTFFCMVYEIVSSLFIGLGLGYLGGIVLKRPLWQVYAMINIAYIFKASIGQLRFNSKKWMKNLTVIGEVNDELHAGG